MGPQVGPSWAEVGALLAEVDPKSGQCCGHVGSKLHLGDFGPTGELCNLPKPRALFGALLPPEAAPVWQICPYHSLLSYHASAPSARADLNIQYVMYKQRFVLK